MAIRRVPVETVADPENRTICLEGPGTALLPPNKVYVDPDKGTVRHGEKGDRLIDLSGDEIEIPRTTWY